jgi:hypothetical protein
MAEEPEPRETSAPHDRRSWVAVGPAIRCRLDLGTGDPLVGPGGESQIASDNEKVDGDAA